MLLLSHPYLITLSVNLVGSAFKMYPQIQTLFSIVHSGVGVTVTVVVLEDDDASLLPGLRAPMLAPLCIYSYHQNSSQETLL